MRFASFRPGGSWPATRRPRSSRRTAATRESISSPGASALGRWSQRDGRWSLAVHGEPGLALGAIVTRANALGITIEALDFRRPGLEDAFIAITGEGLDESGAGEGEPAESGRDAA